MAGNAISFMEPVQIAATLGAAINFGGSVLQSPLIMPMVTDTIVNVPVHYTAQQTAYLLHNSEHFFPPLNALCSLANLIMTGTAYYYSKESPTLAAKLPRLAIAAGLNIATTAWALGIMVPMNKRMGVLSTELTRGVQSGEEKEARHKLKERQFRELQKTWRFRNYGRAIIMLASAIAGATALVVKV
ncbi:hypothetical protein MBLNU459_g0847t2 [Dothideomycetes sp. NU459]